MVLHSLESFLLKYIGIFVLLFGLVTLAGRILGGLEKTTSKRYSLHI